MKRIVLTPLLLTLIIILCSVNAFSLFGDIDNDGEISAEDARTALLIALDIYDATEEEKDKADIIRDGYVNIDDARELLKIAAEISPAPQHKYSPFETVYESTCKTHGIAKSVCEYCNDVKYKELPLKEHTVGICETCKRSFPLSVSLSNYSLLFGQTKDEVLKITGTPTEILNNNGKPILVYENESILNVLMFNENNEFCAIYTTDKKTVFYDGTLKMNFTVIFGKNITVDNINYKYYEDTLSSESNDIYAMLVKTTDSDVITLNNDNISAFEKINFYLLNNVRILNGINPLIYDEQLSNVARLHSEDMAENGYFAHENLNGDKALQRMLDYGIIDETRQCGENICASTPDVFYANDGWYNSSVHRKVILSNDYLSVGIGFCYNENSEYKYYGTQDYLR